LKINKLKSSPAKLIPSNKVAMKIVDKRSLDAENLAKIEREIQILQRLSHPFIVKLFEVIRTERCLYIVTEYVPNGELFGEPNGQIFDWNIRNGGFST
jgi:serine/threonine protein kinase